MENQSTTFVPFMKKETRGRKPKIQVVKNNFIPESIKLVRGRDLNFNEALFVPLKTDREIDVLLSTEKGLMPGTNMVIVGGPGSGKTTLTLDWLSDFTAKGYKVLFVSAEMDEIAYYKYCKRMPKFSIVQTLFLKNHADSVKETLEYVFDQGYDVICIDSIAEVLGMYKDCFGGTETSAEFWFLHLQDKIKKGENSKNYFTSFINIQQTTKGNDFVGSNRLKHMTDAMAHIERSKDGLERTLHFTKNRDCDKDFKMNFSFYNNEVNYTYESISE
jgi:predicted ATP-dependent serine protease